MRALSDTLSVLSGIIWGTNFGVIKCALVTVPSDLFPSFTGHSLIKYAKDPLELGTDGLPAEPELVTPQPAG